MKQEIISGQFTDANSPVALASPMIASVPCEFEFGICAVAEETCDIISAGMNRFNMEEKVNSKIIHKRNCVRPTAPIPMIFPIISWKGLTDEITTSAILFVF